MNQNAVVLEISSDEDIDFKDNGGDNDDDYNWLTEVLQEFNQEKHGRDNVVAVNKNERSGKKLRLNLKSCLVNDDDDDDDDDCVVLENDPNESVEVSVSKCDGGGDNDDSDEIIVVSEKGKVACRDYPHSRHLCIKFPFSTTPNQSHCEQCYCYVCDSLAPCTYWGNGSTTTDHCHATDKDELWRHKRKTAKNGTKPVQPVHKVAESLPLNQLHSVHRHRAASASNPALVQLPHHTSANLRTRNIIKKNRHHLFSSRYKFHPDVVSHYHKTNVARTNTSYDLRTQIQRPVLKTRLARCRTSLGNPSTQLNDHLSGMLSGAINSNKYLRPHLPPIAVNASNNLNLNFQSQVNSNPVYQQPYLAPPLPPRSQVASSRSSSTVPAKQSYPVNSSSRLLPDPNFSIRTHPQCPVTNPGFKGKRLNSATPQVSVTNEATNGLNSATAQRSVSNEATNELNSATAQGSVSNEATNELNSATAQGSVLNEATNESSLLEVVPDELTNYDWIFDNQPVEQGLTDLHGVYGLNDFSSDSGLTDAGPIFNF